MITSSRSRKSGAVAVLLCVVAFASVALADHSWGGYHWARNANPLSLKLGDNVSSSWDGYLVGASTDWSLSSVLDTTVVPGATNAKNCRATNGRVEVCNSKYGKTGWLGIASVWTNGDHIAQGTVKLNDTYFATTKYNTTAWKNFVACQEVGHTFGLDHQDEDFTNPNLGTCMDYTSDPTSNQHPNLHDYEELETIYAHVDTFNSASNAESVSPALAAAGIDPSTDPSEWGEVVRKSHDGRSAVYERSLGKDSKVFTFVIWAD